jgi:hypothetical protein
VVLPALAAPAPARAQAPHPMLDILAGQELIYRGRFEEARNYFASHTAARPGDPAGPVLEASALIWWGEARDEETWQADTIDLLLDAGISRARSALAVGPDSTRVMDLFWLATAFGYRARQAELRGNFWRAAREARAMRTALDQALAIDSSCVDCLLGLGVYDYALARTGALARLVARIIGLGGGNAQKGLERMRQAADHGLLTRHEARWVLANALIRDGAEDEALRAEGLRLIAALAAEFPQNPAFRRTPDSGR